MRTFDEAVKAAFMIGSARDINMASREETLDRLNKIASAQMEFSEDITDNEVIMKNISVMSEMLIHRHANIFADGDSGNLEKSAESIVTVTIECFLTAFSWGLTVGRKMEEQNLEASVCTRDGAHEGPCNGFPRKDCMDFAISRAESRKQQGE